MSCGFAVSPFDGDSIYVGYTDGSVYATADGGDHWHPLQLEAEKLYGVRLIAAS